MTQIQNASSYGIQSVSLGVARHRSCHSQGEPRVMTQIQNASSYGIHKSWNNSLQP